VLFKKKKKKKIGKIVSWKLIESGNQNHKFGDERSVKDVDDICDNY
jgi:hypothetical protein